MKYQQTKDDLIEQWNDQIDFIKRSCDSYDTGIHSEAKRIATSIRVLFHNTRYSKSLSSQLRYCDDFLFWSSAQLYTPSNLLPSWTLLSLNYEWEKIIYLPILKSASRTFYLNFEDWWNEIIFDDKLFFLSRADVVLSVANKDGGAHVDPEFDESYSRITKNNSLGHYIETNVGVIPPSNNPIYASIRQIACEVLESWSLFEIPFTRAAHVNRKFEMRYVDENRRFKWSETDITFSDETKNIVDNYKSEPRKYYVYSFDKNMKKEVIIS